MKFLMGIFFLLLTSCMTLPSGEVKPDIELIKELTIDSTYVVATIIQERGLDPSKVKKHILNVRQIINETPQGQMVDLASINGYLEKYIPNEYKPIARLIILIVERRVQPILQSQLSDSEKAQEVIKVINSVLDGVNTGLSFK